MRHLCAQKTEKDQTLNSTECLIAIYTMGASEPQNIRANAFYFLSIFISFYFQTLSKRQNIHLKRLWACIVFTYSRAYVRPGSRVLIRLRLQQCYGIGAQLGARLGFRISYSLGAALLDLDSGCGHLLRQPGCKSVCWGVLIDRFLRRSP